MSWRRFLVLLRGLSINSSTVLAARSRIQFGEKSVNTVDTTKAAQQTFAAMFGRSKPPA